MSIKIPSQSEIVRLLGILLINNEIARMDYRADIQDAEERGIKIGEERGENRLLRLMQLLTAQNRNDDISRIMTDKAYLQELYRAYSI